MDGNRIMYLKLGEGFWHSRNWATGIREDRHDDDE